MIKKRLAGNQIIIAYLRKVEAFDSYEVKPAITAKMAGKTFKAQGAVKISKAGKSISLLFEVVRREEDWQKKLIERMRLYKDFYENFVPFDSGYEIKPQIVIVCEDDRHMVETFKEIVTNAIEIKGVKLCFTTDLRQNDTHLSKSLVEFKMDEETKKYKVETLELKILE